MPSEVEHSCVFWVGFQNQRYSAGPQATGTPKAHTGVWFHCATRWISSGPHLSKSRSECSPGIHSLVATTGVAACVFAAAWDGRTRSIFTLSLRLEGRTWHQGTSCRCHLASDGCHRHVRMYLLGQGRVHCNGGVDVRAHPQPKHEH